MKYFRLSFISLLLFILAPSFPVSGQSWDFVKEKDGIKIYTRREENSSLKSFKGVADIHTRFEKACDLIGNVKHLDWWDKNLREIRVLHYEKDKWSQYYLVYDSPWPVTDRDLCVNATITTDSVTGVRTIFSVPLLNVIPENPQNIRITDYWQRWTIEPVNSDLVHVVLEGYVDPAGSVPDWIYNMVITETPLKIIRGIKKRLESK